LVVASLGVAGLALLVRVARAALAGDLRHGILLMLVVAAVRAEQHADGAGGRAAQAVPEGHVR
jgi:hypothetical protein